MRVLFWFCNNFNWTPAIKTLENAPDGKPAENDNTVVAFIHIEPRDVEDGSSAETKLVKNSKWLARKWETENIVLHSFTHLGEEKVEKAGYSIVQTPYGYFLDLEIKAPGHPLARIYKEF